MSAPLTILVDGACPLCQREARLLARLDRGRGNLTFIDISEPGFDASRYGLSPEQVHAEIHALRADGTILRGMPVFRAAYRAVGWGWILAPTGWPVLRTLFDAAYRWFARNRHRLTRRPCSDGACVRPSR